MSHTEYGPEAPSAAAPSRKPWLVRAAYAIGFGILAYALIWVVFALAVLQLVVALVTGAPNAQLAVFGRRVATWLGEIVRYLTMASDQAPFPFADFPND